VVTAIIALLIGLLLPAVQQVREAANRTSCANNLHQIGIACRLYEHIHDTLPPSQVREHGASWMVLIWPYLEQEPLYSRWDINKTYYQQLDQVRLAQLKVYFCPSRRASDTSPGASTSGDNPPPELISGTNLVSLTGQPLTAQNYPGGLSDYAGNLGLSDL
jgi:hypothetical protein